MEKFTLEAAGRFVILLGVMALWILALVALRTADIPQDDKFALSTFWCCITMVITMLATHKWHTEWPFSPWGGLLWITLLCASVFGGVGVSIKAVIHQDYILFYLLIPAVIVVVWLCILRGMIGGGSVNSGGD